MFLPLVNVKFSIRTLSAEIVKNPLLLLPFKTVLPEPTKIIFSLSIIILTIDVKVSLTKVIIVPTPAC